MIQFKTIPWFGKTACSGLASDDKYATFFPDDEEDKTEALKYCNTCQVKEDCLNYALQERIEYGIWGGFNSRERKILGG